MSKNLTNEEVLEVANRINLLLPFVKDLKLQGYIDTINIGDAIMPMIDPTFYRDNMKTGQRNRQLAEALLVFQKQIEDIEAEILKEAGDKGERLAREAGHDG